MTLVCEKANCKQSMNAGMKRLLLKIIFSSQCKQFLTQACCIQRFVRLEAKLTGRVQCI